MGIVEDTRFAALEARLASLEAWRASGATPSGGVISTRSHGGDVADASDLDGQYGDPEVRKDPPRWNGESYVGRPFSTCPSDYLRQLAGFFDWQAGKDEESGNTHKGKPTAPYRRQDAARARGWAKRNEGKAVQAPLPKAAPAEGRGEYTNTEEPEIPF